MGRNYVRPSVRPSVHLSVAPPPAGPTALLLGPQAPLSCFSGRPSDYSYGPSDLSVWPTDPSGRPLGPSDWPSDPFDRPSDPQTPVAGPQTSLTDPQTPSMEGGQTDRWTDGGTDRISPHSTGLCSLLGLLPCYPLRLDNINKAGQGNR